MKNKHGNLRSGDADPHPVTAELEAALRAESQAGRISCVAASRVAASFGITPAEVGRAIEGLGLRVSGCQLGCF